MDRPLYYQNYHKHTSQSHRYSKDSPLVPSDYFNAIKESLTNGFPTSYSTVEHGWQGTYFRIYEDLEKFNSKNNSNTKFVFGTEMYWVKDRFEKDNSNCHIILLAKNENGRKAINKAISTAYKTGYYYKARIDLEILFSLPKDDIFVTTACVAFWNKYDDIDNIVLKLNEHFTDFYLEAQCHHTEKQRATNKHILELSKTYNIPLIAGVDSHVIKESQLADRDDLLLSSGISYDDEDGWFMDYPNVDTLIDRFTKQNVLSQEEIYQAINNTNKILDFEDIVLDKSIKVPVLKKYKHLNQDERNKIFIDILKKEWGAQKEDINKNKIAEYKREIKHDIGEILACNMADYFIDNYEIMNLGIDKYGGRLTPSGRGSAVSMYLNKLLGFTRVDKVNSPVVMYSERFLTKERILESHTPPDIDHNVSSREPFIHAQEELIGSAYDLIALGTLHYKSAFKMYSRAYNLDPQLANEVTAQIAKYEDALKYAEDDEKDMVDIYDYVDKSEYGNLIEGCKPYMGIIDNIKGHPCGCLCYDGDVESDVGVILCKSETTGKETLVAVIESGTIDSFGYLKQDYLVVDSIGLAYDIYEEIGIEPMTMNQLMNVVESDKKVWDIYSKGITMCINQCEQTASTKKMVKYKASNVSELTQFIASIRPSFKSMYHTFEARKHFDYGIKALDNVIQDEYMTSSFIIFQETLMKILGFAGFPMAETYNIIKAISKKKHYIIDNAKKTFIPNFKQAILDTKETEDENEAERLANAVWKIIEDSASYGFNSSHAFCMAIDSVTLAWMKANYPLEFYKVTLQRYTNKGNKNKVTLLKKEMMDIGIKLNNVKFRDDNRTFTINREDNSINQTMSAVKGMSKNVASALYEAKDIVFNSNLDLYEYLYSTKDENNKKIFNKTSLDILFKLDYFKELGNVNQLIYEYDIFNKFSKCKSIKLDKWQSYGYDDNIIKQCSGKITAKTFAQIDNIKLIQMVIDNTDTPKTREIDKMLYQIELLGYSDMKISKAQPDLYIVLSTETTSWGTTFVKLYQIQTGIEMQYKADKKFYKNNQLAKLDIIRAVFDTKPKFKKVNDEFKKTGEYERVMKIWGVIKK